MDYISSLQEVHATKHVVDNLQRMLLREIIWFYFLEQVVKISLNTIHNNENGVEGVQILFGLHGQYYVKHFDCKTVAIHFGQFMHQLQLSQCVLHCMLANKHVFNQLYGNLPARQLALRFDDRGIGTLAQLSLDYIIIPDVIPNTILLLINIHEKCYFLVCVKLIYYKYINIVCYFNLSLFNLIS